MKNFFLTMFFLVGATSVMACELPEAQFIGNVINYDKADCTYQISYREYNESGVCGLHMDDAESAWFKDKTCSLQNGTEVSGYLIIRDERVEIED